MAGIGTAYLVSYNLCQFFGWLYLLTMVAPQFVNCMVGENGDLERHQRQLYADTHVLLQILCLGGILEVFHAAVGLVKSSAVITAFQVSARLFATCVVARNIPEAQVCKGYAIFALAFCLVEIIRYPFYALALLGIDVYIVNWLRYTAFIILYPMGGFGEVYSYYSALPSVYERGLLSVKMPNPMNIVVNFYYVLIVVIVLYFLMFPVMYTHMFAQRKKFLSKSNEIKKKA